MTDRPTDAELLSGATIRVFSEESEYGPVHRVELTFETRDEANQCLDLLTRTPLAGSDGAAALAALSPSPVAEEMDKLRADNELLRAQLHGMQDGSLLRDTLAENDRLRAAAAEGGTKAGKHRELVEDLRTAFATLDRVCEARSQNITLHKHSGVSAEDADAEIRACGVVMDRARLCLSALTAAEAPLKEELLHNIDRALRIAGNGQ